MCAVDSFTLGKPALAGNCALMLACSAALYGNWIYLADMRIIPSHTAGMARLRVDWHSPDRSASSLWNPLLLGTPVWSAPVLVQAAHGSSPCCAPRPAAALRTSPRTVPRTVPGGLPLKRLMSQLSSCASRSSLSLNTRSLCIAPFTISSNTAKAAVAVIFCTTLRFYIHSSNCRHVGVLIVHQC